jgi:multiple sugar transport system permease protein
MAVTPMPVTRRRPTQRTGLLATMGRHWADYLYILPALAVMIVVIAYPIYYTVYLSFFNTPPSSPNWYFNGVDNYKAILSDGTYTFWDATKNTVVWTVGSTFFAFILGFGAALLVHREFVMRGLVRGLLLVPWVISAVPAAYIWRWMYHSDYGLISGTLMQLGIVKSPIIFLDSVDLALPALIVVNVWKEFPFAMIMLLAGLQTVPSGLLRAARVDGAGAWQTFINVTVPHLKGVIVITTILLFVQNLNSFTLPFIMTGGGPANSSMIWIVKIYLLAFQDLRYGLASAFAVILFLMMLVLGYFYVKALTDGDRRPA